MSRTSFPVAHRSFSRRPQAAATFAFASLALLACGAPRTDGTGGTGSVSSAVISDATHSKGNAGFVWLPPMVPAPASYGDFVEGLPVTIRVDELNNDGTVKRSLATFTARSGPERESMRTHKENGKKYDGDGDNDDDTHGYYLARWDTDDAHLSTSANYRARVFVPRSAKLGGGTVELGFADVKVVRDQKTFKGVDTDEYTPLVNGKVLRIKCRVGKKAVDADGDGVWDWNDNCPNTANANQKDTVGNGIGDACRCDTVKCVNTDLCHLPGVCAPTTGLCSVVNAPDGHICTEPNATATCKAGVCTRTACNAGFADCNGLGADGCEVNTTTTANCGGCGVACGNGATCTAGKCTNGCAAGTADCDGKAGNGCEATLATDAANCGACGIACTNDQLCVGGVCTAVVCSAGTADCNQIAKDGCEVTTSSDVKNCGACGTTCSANNGTPSCVAGNCAVGSCSAGYANCDGKVGNGCETSTASDASNCGACGTVCSFAHAAAACGHGVCMLAACDPGFDNCDQATANGCEADLSSTKSCGACGNVCNLAHATPACTNGACAIAQCDAGWKDCDGNPANGCEADLAGTDNCGGCGVSCFGAAVNTTGACVQGVCLVTCDPGYADCDGRPGCEANVSGTDVNNCGACGNACAQGEVCQSGVCSAVVCSAGTADCDRKAGNGCEITTTTDVNNCGACGTVCSFANATPTCAAGTCGFSVCLANFSDCDGKPANGCEASLQDDPKNCGGCGISCGTGACTNGKCAVGVLSPGNTYADGQGVGVSVGGGPSAAWQNYYARFTVHSVDSNGLPYTTGGATVAATATTQSTTWPVTVTDLGDGTYDLKYLPTNTESITVAITMNGTPIQGSPFTAFVLNSAHAPYCSLSSVQNAAAGDPLSWSFSMVDANLIPVLDFHDNFQLVVTNGYPLAGIVFSQGFPGTGVLSLEGPFVGTCNAIVHVVNDVNSLVMTGSPFSIQFA